MEKLSSVRDALHFLIKGLYDAEQETYEMLDRYDKHQSTLTIKNQLDNCHQRQWDVLKKFQKLFRYLKQEPGSRTHKVIKDLIVETRERLRGETDQAEKDLLLIRTLESVNEYKISDYQTCLHFANELNEGEVAELLLELLRNSIQSNLQIIRLELMDNRLAQLVTS